MWMRCFGYLSFGTVLLAVPGPQPFGQIAGQEDFLVNTYTTSHQSMPDVSGLPGGGFIVVWESDGSAGTDKVSTSIQGRLFTPTGAPAGAQFQVNTYFLMDQRDPAVAVTPNGEILVVWESPTATSGIFTTIQAQLFGSDGTPLGGQFQVNTFSAGSQSSPDVAANADGFAVAWGSNGSFGTDTDSFSVQLRRFASDGTPLSTEEFQVNTETAKAQGEPAIAMAPSGESVVVWVSSRFPQAGDPFINLQGQYFSAGGAPVGGQFQVNANIQSDAVLPAAAIHPSGAFAVTWRMRNFDAPPTVVDLDVFARIFSPGGIPITGDFQVNTLTAEFQTRPDIAAIEDERFIVVWDSDESEGGDNSSASVQARLFAQDGRPLSQRELQVNSFTESAQGDAAVSPTRAGQVVVAWTSHLSPGIDASGSNIHARLLRLPPAPVTTIPTLTPWGAVTLAAALGLAAAAALQRSRRRQIPEP